MIDVKYRVDAGRSKQSVEQTNRLLQAVSEIQLKFIRESAAHSWFEETLRAFLDVTGSEYGFIGTVHHDDDELPWLQTRTISNIAWDQASREVYESSIPEGLQLRNLKTSLGQTLSTGELFVSNSPDEDAHSDGLPPGHPVLTAFMAIPLKIDDQLIGVVGIANRPNGYDSVLASWLEPLCTTCATLMIASKSQEARHFGILKAITEGTSELIFAKDLDSRPVFVNEAVAKMFGTTAEQMIGKPEDNFFSEQTLKQIIADDQRIIRTGQTETFEEELPTSSGARLFHTTKSPWRDSSGEIVGVIGVSRDVTEWKKTQNSLHQSRERLRAIIENTPGCVKLVAKDGTLLEINAAGVRMCEADSAESLLGGSVLDLIPDEHRPAFVRFHERVCDGISGSMQFELVGEQGTRRWLETHAVPLPLGPDGSIVHLAVTHDITAARVAEETIAAQQSQLIHVSRLSSMGQMVAVISHEITQPLAAIANYSSACELLATEPTTDLQKLREYLASITAQSARAGQILGRVRNFVKHSDEHRIESDIIQLTKDSLNLVKADLRSRHVSVETSFPDRTVFASVDPVQIQQVIVNLISNACDAIESQPTGQRRISISLQDSEGSVAVEIVDSGPGLPIDLRDQLFEPFYTSRTNGMGMGLSICSDIVNSHSGTITADNVPNSGARFRFTLPRSKEIINE